MPESKDRSTVLARTLAGVARRMRADFERSAEINHAGSKGTVREDLIIANFLRDYLPGTVEVAGSSEILDISGERSPQNDVVIYDRSAPPLYRENQFRIFPAECVYGTLEVKSKLDTRELIDSLDKAERVKNLRKTEYHPNPLPQTRTQYGQVWTYCPTASFVFAYDSIDLDSLAEALVKRYENTPHALRVDGVWVLGKGYLTWFHQSENRILPSSEPGARLGVQDVHENQDVLLHMVLILNAHFVKAWMPPFRLLGYAGNAPLGERRTLWTVGEPEG